MENDDEDPYSKYYRGRGYRIINCSSGAGASDASPSTSRVKSTMVFVIEDSVAMRHQLLKPLLGIKRGGYASEGRTPRCDI